jgi:hypothetical protein
LASLPTNNTNILHLDYDANGHAHTLPLRIVDGATVGDAITMAASLIPAISALWYASTTGVMARWQEKGANISLPISFPDWENAVGTYTGSAAAGRDVPRFISLPIRSQGGRRGRLTLFGIQPFIDDTFRYEYGDNVLLDALMDAVGAALVATAGKIVGIDGLALLAYNIVNLGMNAHFQRKQRRG